MATVAELLAETLLKAGVSRVYGIIGTSIVDLVDSLYDYRSRLDLVTTRHEQVAASAADAEFRVSRKLSAAAVHAGPGFLNTLISLGIAYKDRVPFILVSGGVRRRLRGTGAWLEVDQQSIAKPLAKYYGIVNSPGEALQVFAEAIRAAVEPPMGPAVIEVPEDLWKASAPVDKEVLEGIGVRSEPKGVGDEAREIAYRLAEAKKPVILATGELAYSPDFRQESLLRLAEATGAYIVVSGNGRGACPEDHLRCLGRVGFGGGSIAADRTLESSDLLLVFGYELDDITTYAYTMLPEGDVILISQDPLAEKRPAYYELYRASPSKALEEILEAAKPAASKDGWDREVGSYKREWRAMLSSAVERKTSMANPDRFFHILDGQIPRNRVVSGGQGTHILYTYNHLKIYRPGGFLAATNLGAMGYALPAAIGASKAAPHAYNLCVAGDGELMMTIQDLETITREGLDVKIILVNDDSYKVLYLRQILQKMGRVYGTLLTNPDFESLAHAFNINYVRIEKYGEEERGVEALRRRGPTLAEIKISKDDIPPLNLDYTLRMSL